MDETQLVDDVVVEQSTTTTAVEGTPDLKTSIESAPVIQSDLGGLPDEKIGVKDTASEESIPVGVEKEQTLGPIPKLTEPELDIEMEIEEKVQGKVQVQEKEVEEEKAKEDNTIEPVKNDISTETINEHSLPSPINDQEPAVERPRPLPNSITISPIPDQTSPSLLSTFPPSPVPIPIHSIPSPSQPPTPTQPTGPPITFIHPTTDFFSPSLYIPPTLSSSIHRPLPSIHPPSWVLNQPLGSQDSRKPSTSTSNSTSTGVITILAPPPTSEWTQIKEMWGNGESPEGKEVNPLIFRLDQASLGKTVVEGKEQERANEKEKEKEEEMLEEGEIGSDRMDQASTNRIPPMTGNPQTESKFKSSQNYHTLKPFLIDINTISEPITLTPQHYHPKVIALARKMAEQRGIRLDVDEEQVKRMKEERMKSRKKVKVDAGPSSTSVIEKDHQPMEDVSPITTTTPILPFIPKSEPIIPYPNLTIILPPTPTLKHKKGTTKGRGNRGANNGNSVAARRQRELAQYISSTSNNPGSPGGGGASSSGLPVGTRLMELNGALVLVDAEGNLVPHPSDTTIAGGEGDQEERDSKKRRLVNQGMGSASWWNHLLITARRQRGPQWDINTQSYQVDRNSSLYFSAINAPIPPSPPPFVPITLPPPVPMQMTEDVTPPISTPMPTQPSPITMPTLPSHHQPSPVQQTRPSPLHQQSSYGFGNGNGLMNGATPNQVPVQPQPQSHPLPQSMSLRQSHPIPGQSMPMRTPDQVSSSMPMPSSGPIAEQQRIQHIQYMHMQAQAQAQAQAQTQRNMDPAQLDHGGRSMAMGIGGGPGGDMGVNGNGSIPNLIRPPFGMNVNPQNSPALSAGLAGMTPQQKQQMMAFFQAQQQQGQQSQAQQQQHQQQAPIQHQQHRQQQGFNPNGNGAVPPQQYMYPGNGQHLKNA